MCVWFCFHGCLHCRVPSLAAPSDLSLLIQPTPPTFHSLLYLHHHTFVLFMPLCSFSPPSLSPVSSNRLLSWGLIHDCGRQIMKKKGGDLQGVQTWFRARLSSMSAWEKANPRLCVSLSLSRGYFCTVQLTDKKQVTKNTHQKMFGKAHFHVGIRLCLGQGFYTLDGWFAGQDLLIHPRITNYKSTLKEQRLHLQICHIYNQINLLLQRLFK